MTLCACLWTWNPGTALVLWKREAVRLGNLLVEAFRWARIFTLVFEEGHVVWICRDAWLMLKGIQLVGVEKHVGSKGTQESGLGFRI